MSKLDGIKPGDRVRVTFEGVVANADASGIDVQTDGAQHQNGFFPDEINTPTFHIERLEKPLEVGNRVRVRGENAVHEVLRVVGHQAVILTTAGDPFADVLSLSDLERIA